MLKKKINVLKDHLTGYDFYQENILSAMNFLNSKIKEMDSSPEKSLFFQNPQIIEGWLVLVRAIKKIENRDFQKKVKEWKQRTDPYAVTLLARRELFVMFKKLYRAYYDPLYKLWMDYSGWLDEDCISADCREAISIDKYEKVLDVEDINQHLENLNRRSLDARYATYKTLSDIFDLLQTMMNRGGQIVIDQNPSDEDIAKAIDEDLREWTRNFGEDMFKEMKEDLTRHYKEHRTDPYKPELWGEMLSADEEALRMANNQDLSQCEDVKQEHWGEDMKKLMDENGKLMQQIYFSCHTEELFDLGKVDNVQPFIALLTAENLDMFYEIIVRRSLIQCEMFPDLKKQHDAWLNKTIDQHEDSEDNLLSDARQSKQDENAPKDVEVDEKENVDEDELIAKLKPIFYNNEENVRRFLTEIKNMPTESITDLVNQWVTDKLISNYGNSRKGTLWGILN